MSSSDTTPPAMQPSAGELLRAARESAGLHIAALAVMLKVPVKKLEALETSRFDLLPDTVFVRALASSVCRTLKIDAAPIMERLPQSGATQLAHYGQAINAPFRSTNDGPKRYIWSGLHRPAVAFVLLLLLGSLALAFWPIVTTQLKRLSGVFDMGAVTSDRSTAQSGSSEPFDLKSEKALIGNANSPVVAAAGIGPDRNAAAAPGMSGAAPAGATTAIPGSAAPLAGSSTVTLPATLATPAGLIVFRATGESWVEVTDSKKQVVLRRLLTQGESVGVSGSLPLSATVGRANMTQVDVRGQSFDLAPWSKDNVARFEVK